MEPTTNPYQTPSGQLTVNEEGHGDIRFFSPSIRIGRLRYLAHGFLFAIAFYAILAAGLGLAIGVSGFFWVLVAAAYIGFVVVTVILLIQRLHDLNHSGWLSLLMFVPLLNFVFALYIIFAPGTKGTNNYGLQPPPNKTWHWILGLMWPVLAVIGIVAAISLPAYQGYLDRAAESGDYSNEYYYDYDDEEDDE